MRVAGIDCGTNSIRLLIADGDGNGGLVDVVRRMEVVRLGEGVDATGRIGDAAMSRTLAMAGEYGRLCREHGVERIRFAATSATRDAANRGDFVDGVRAALGVEPEVITGEEEAALSFGGAVGSLASSHPGPYLVVDIGGGSTEFVLGAASDEGGVTVEASRSFDIGCVRLTERHRPSDPPTAVERAAIGADISAVLDRAAEAVPLYRARTLIGVAGTVTTVTAHALRLARYEPEVLHGAALTPARIRAAAEELVVMPRAARAVLPYMHPGRVDVIGAGALVWTAVVDAVVASGTGAGVHGGGTGAGVHGEGMGLFAVLASEHDILDGLAASVLG